MIAISTTGLLRAAFLAWAFLVLSAPAQAQKPSANAIAIAKEIIILKGAATILDPMVPGVVERVKFTLMQTNPMLQKPLEDVSAFLRKQYANRAAQLHENLARLYAARFTEAELKQVLAFYKSAAGKKVISQEALIFEENIEQLKIWQEKFSEEVLARFRAEMRKRGHDI
jgi:hypothetical protein